MSPKISYRSVFVLFSLAKEKAPTIIFIDELDAIGTKRFDSEKAGDREVQRTMLELLNQLDGFEPNTDIKGNQILIICFILFHLILFLSYLILSSIYIYMFNKCYIDIEIHIDINI